MKIIEAHDNLGWITAIICGRWVQAKQRLTLKEMEY